MAMYSDQKRNLINGEWISSAQSIANINPSDTSDVVGSYARATAADADSAVVAAAVAAKSWRNSTPQVRADILDHVGTTLLSQSAEIGRLLSREEGKTLTEGIGEVTRTGQIFKYYAQEALRIYGDALSSLRPSVDVEITREPVGVIGIITPWNFPIAIPAWKIAPALAFGNTVVFKPAELTPACGHVLAEILIAAGIPDGVFNLVSGPGSVVGNTIVAHKGVDAISFTGSVAVGQSLAKRAIEGMKKLQLEMGGKNPMIVAADADLNIAIESCVNGAFYSTGQRCTASSRLIVDSDIYDEFVDGLVNAMKGLTVGNALDSETQIGPVVSQQQLESNRRYIEIGRHEATDVVGGESLELDPQGFYQAPALFVGVTNDDRVAREEIFGPCAAVIRVEDFDEAVDVANDTEYGLCAGICTSSLNHAREFKRRSESGMVMVNLPTAGVDYHVPFGGKKSSSYGYREQGRSALEFFTSSKTAYIRTH